jgi:hypothetical protein
VKSRFSAAPGVSKICTLTDQGSGNRRGDSLARRNITGGTRRRAVIRAGGAVVFVSAMLYWEQTAIIYVLSTLAIAGLLLVVAFSDLEGRDRELSAQLKDDVPVGTTTGESPSDVPGKGHTGRRGRPQSRRLGVGG